MGSPKTKRLALNGILGALSVICLLLADILPTNRISLYALSSFFISISIIENGIRAGWIFYAATCLLSVIIVPDKLSIVPYAIFFGIYGIVKFYIERLRRSVLEYILKFAYFNVCLGIAFWALKGLFRYELKIMLPVWLLVAAAEIVFLIYDVVYTLFIDYYRSKLRALIK
jgi:hypothetical protein